MIGARAIAYRRRATPLHAARAPVAACYGLALATAALILSNPLLLGALLIATLAAAAAAGVLAQLLVAVRATALALLVLTVAVNAIVSRHGLTVLARLGDWGPVGQVDVTLEAVAYGALMALRLLVVMCACLLVVCAADPDELLRSCRRLTPSSALTAVLATRLVPVLAQDARRLAEAQRCRPDGGPRGGRARLAILRATVGGALERSLDVAAVLEMRGYGAGGRAARRRLAPSRHDLAFAACAAALLALAVAAAASGATAFSAYPSLRLELTPATLALVPALVVLALAPFADRRGIQP